MTGWHIVFPVLYGLFLQASPDKATAPSQYSHLKQCLPLIEQGWRKYVDHSLTINGELVVQRSENKKVIELVLCKLIGNGVNWIETDGVGTSLKEAQSMRLATIVRTVGVNRQLLHLRRNDKIQDNNWYIKIEEYGDDSHPLPCDSKEYLYKHYTTCNPNRLCQHGEVPVKMLLESPAFHLNSFSSFVRDGVSIVRIEYTVDNKKAAPKNQVTLHLRQGWLELLPDQCWVMHRGECLLAYTPPGATDARARWFRTEYHYDTKSAPVPLLRSIKEVTIDQKEHPDWPVLEYSIESNFQIPAVLPGEDAFLLKHFGLPERDPSASVFEEPEVKEAPGSAKPRLYYVKPQSDWWFSPWAWLTLLGIVLLIAGMLLRRKRVSSSPTVKQS